MILFVLPPLTQLNTPYPSITHLTGYLRSRGIEAEQMDLGIELINRLFTRVELGRVFDVVEKRVENRELKLNKMMRIIVSNRGFYERNVEAVMKFLSGRDLQLANRFSDLRFWEDMHRLPNEEELEWAFGTSGKVDRAKYLCSLFLKNVVDVVQLLDEHFQLIRYAERLCTYLAKFEPLEMELGKMSLTENISLTESTELTEKASLRLALGNGNMIEELLLELLEQKLQEVKPDWVGLSIPFPGNLLAGL
ncbi:MAG: hypothetical protein UH103_04580, partial [Paludibacteraceae bacterium]|nr:hypothetical protein [Paludibacteraceae bacterium]